MIGELVHCDPALIDSAETYRLYLQAVRDVCSFFLSERGGIYSGDMGRGGGGVARTQLPAEVRNFESVRGFLEDRGDLGWTPASVDGEVGAVGSTSAVSRRGGESKAVEAGAEMGVGSGGANCGSGSAVREFPVDVGSSEQASGVTGCEPVGVAGEEGLSAGLEVPVGTQLRGAFTFRGPNYERNRRNRERRKQARRDVQKLSEEKVRVQNELAVLEAKRKIEVLKARDVEQEKRADRVRIQRSVERDMVAIEKSHATLRATGNVPGEMGFCETIVGSGSISPDSSASQADVRAMKKELEDGKLENEKLKKILKRHGLPVVDPDLYDKHTWTDNEENMQLLDEMYPDGCAFNDVYAPPGKVHVVGY